MKKEYNSPKVDVYEYELLVSLLEESAESGGDGDADDWGDAPPRRPEGGSGFQDKGWGSLW